MPADGSVQFQPGGSPVQVAPNAQFANNTGLPLNSVVIQLINPPDGTSEELSVPLAKLPTDITVTPKSGLGQTLTLESASTNSPALMKEFAALLTEVTYQDTASNPTPGPRSITFQAEGQDETDIATYDQTEGNVAVATVFVAAPATSSPALVAGLEAQAATTALASTATTGASPPLAGKNDNTPTMTITVGSSDPFAGQGAATVGTAASVPSSTVQLAASPALSATSADAVASASATTASATTSNGLDNLSVASLMALTPASSSASMASPTAAAALQFQAGDLGSLLLDDPTDSAAGLAANNSSDDLSNPLDIIFAQIGRENAL